MGVGCCLAQEDAAGPAGAAGTTYAFHILTPEADLAVYTSHGDGRVFWYAQDYHLF
jgi:hypothetical protein